MYKGIIKGECKVLGGKLWLPVLDKNRAYTHFATMDKTKRYLITIKEYKGEVVDNTEEMNNNECI